MDSPDLRTSPTPASSARWFQRVLPVTAIAVALVALAAVVSPAFRDQLRLSATRQAEPYVELYFAQAPRGSTTGVQVTCARSGNRALTAFVVHSHLAGPETIDYRITLTPTGAKAQGKAQRLTGRAEVAPGEQLEVREAFRLPRATGYVLSVTLPGHDQHLRARCAAGRPA